MNTVRETHTDKGKGKGGESGNKEERQERDSAEITINLQSHHGPIISRQIA